MKKLQLLSIFTLLSIALIYSCSTEEEDTTPPPSIIATPEPEPPAPTQYTLTVTAGEGGTVSTEGGTYDEGTEVTITATPGEGYEFVGWEGSDSDTISLTVTLNSNFSLSATFQRTDDIYIDNNGDLNIKGISNGFIINRIKFVFGGPDCSPLCQADIIFDEDREYYNSNAFNVDDYLRSLTDDENATITVSYEKPILQKNNISILAENTVSVSRSNFSSLNDLIADFNWSNVLRDTYDIYENNLYELYNEDGNPYIIYPFPEVIEDLEFLIFEIESFAEYNSIDLSTFDTVDLKLNLTNSSVFAIANGSCNDSVVDVAINYVMYSATNIYVEDYNQNLIRNVLWHELGHDVLNLAHATGGVMTPESPTYDKEELLNQMDLALDNIVNFDCSLPLSSQ